MPDRKVTFIIGANIENFAKGLQKAERTMLNFSRKMERVGRSMTMGLTLPIVGAAGAAIKSAADFEALGVQMEVLTGSAEEGARAFEQLKRFSAQTPFQLQDLVRANNTLMGFGVSTQDAFTHLQTLGDVAAVTGGDLQAISVAFGQAAAEGRLMTRDIRQLINQGVPAIKLLAESMGVAQSEVLDLASAGEITFPVLVKALQEATQEGGQFANGTERLSQTLKGLFSTLKDNVTIALSELGDVISEKLDLKQVVRNLSNFLQNATEAFRNMSSESIERILKIAGMLAISGPLLVAIGKAGQIIVGFARLVRSQFAIITASFAVGVGIGQWFVDNWNALWGEADTDFTSFVESTKRGMKKIIDPIVQFAEEALGASGALEDFYALFQDPPSQSPTPGPSSGGGRSTGGIAAVGNIPLQFINGQQIKADIEGIKNSTVDFSASVSDANGVLNQTTELGALVGDRLGDAFAQATLHAENLGDAIKNIGKQLLSRGIAKFFSLALGGGLGGLFEGGFFKGVGKIFGVGDALIQSNGNIVQFHPDDNILAMKDMSGLGGGNMQLSGEFRVKGTDLVMVLENAQRTLR